MDDLTRDEMERRGDSLLDEEQWRAGRPVLTVPADIECNLEWDGHSLVGRIEHLERFAHQILAECEIARRTHRGEFDG